MQTDVETGDKNKRKRAPTAVTATEPSLQETDEELARRLHEELNGVGLRIASRRSLGSGKLPDHLTLQVPTRNGRTSFTGQSPSSRSNQPAGLPPLPSTSSSSSAPAPSKRVSHTGQTPTRTARDPGFGAASATPAPLPPGKAVAVIADGDSKPTCTAPNRPSDAKTLAPSTTVIPASTACDTDQPGSHSPDNKNGKRAFRRTASNGKTAAATAECPQHTISRDDSLPIALGNNEVVKSQPSNTTLSPNQTTALTRAQRQAPQPPSAEAAGELSRVAMETGTGRLADVSTSPSPRQRLTRGAGATTPGARAPVRQGGQAPVGQGGHAQPSASAPSPAGAPHELVSISHNVSGVKQKPPGLPNLVVPVGLMDPPTQDITPSEQMTSPGTRQTRRSLSRASSQQVPEASPVDVRSTRSTPRHQAATLPVQGDAGHLGDQQAAPAGTINAMQEAESDRTRTQQQLRNNALQERDGNNAADVNASQPVGELASSRSRRTQVASHRPKELAVAVTPRRSDSRVLDGADQQMEQTKGPEGTNQDAPAAQQRSRAPSPRGLDTKGVHASGTGPNIADAKGIDQVHGLGTRRRSDSRPGHSDDSKVQQAMAKPERDAPRQGPQASTPRQPEPVSLGRLDSKQSAGFSQHGERPEDPSPRRLPRRASAPQPPPVKEEQPPTDGGRRRATTQPVKQEAGVPAKPSASSSSVQNVGEGMLLRRNNTAPAAPQHAATERPPLRRHATAPPSRTSDSKDGMAPARAPGGSRKQGTGSGNCGASIDDDPQSDISPMDVDAAPQDETAAGTSGHKPFPKIRAMPMVRHDEKWYRAKVIQEKKGRVLLKFLGFAWEGGAFWLPCDSDRIWRGSYKGKDWRYLNDGAWEPKQARGKGRKPKKPTSKVSSSKRRSRSGQHPSRPAESAGSGGSSSGSDSENEDCDQADTAMHKAAVAAELGTPCSAGLHVRAHSISMEEPPAECTAAAWRAPPILVAVKHEPVAAEHQPDTSMAPGVAKQETEEVAGTLPVADASCAAATAASAELRSSSHPREHGDGSSSADDTGCGAACQKLADCPLLQLPAQDAAVPNSVTSPTRPRRKGKPVRSRFDSEEEPPSSPTPVAPVSAGRGARRQQRHQRAAANGSRASNSSSASERCATALDALADVCDEGAACTVPEPAAQAPEQPQSHLGWKGAWKGHWKKAALHCSLRQEAMEHAPAAPAAPTSPVAFCRPEEPNPRDQAAAHSHSKSQRHLPWHVDAGMQVLLDAAIAVADLGADSSSNDEGELPPPSGRRSIHRSQASPAVDLSGKITKRRRGNGWTKVARAIRSPTATPSSPVHTSPVAHAPPPPAAPAPPPAPVAPAPPPVVVPPLVLPVPAMAAPAASLPSPTTTSSLLLGKPRSSIRRAGSVPIPTPPAPAWAVQAGTALPPLHFPPSLPPNGRYHVSTTGAPPPPNGTGAKAPPLSHLLNLIGEMQRDTTQPPPAKKPRTTGSPGASSGSCMPAACSQGSPNGASSPPPLPASLHPGHGKLFASMAGLGLGPSPAGKPGRSVAPAAAAAASSHVLEPVPQLVAVPVAVVPPKPPVPLFK